MTVATPLWVDALAAAFVIVGGLAALIGSFGVLRLGTFFQRVHAPTLGATLGTWSVVLASIAQGSFARGQPSVHAVVIALCIAVTAPITTIFLLRAAIFRDRLTRSNTL